MFNKQLWVRLKDKLNGSNKELQELRANNKLLEEKLEEASDRNKILEIDLEDARYKSIDISRRYKEAAEEHAQDLLKHSNDLSFCMQKMSKLYAIKIPKYSSILDKDKYISILESLNILNEYCPKLSELKSKIENDMEFIRKLNESRTPDLFIKIQKFIEKHSKSKYLNFTLSENSVLVEKCVTKNGGIVHESKEYTLAEFCYKYTVDI